MIALASLSESARRIALDRFRLLQPTSRAETVTEPSSPIAADSPLAAPRRIQTGQKPLSAVAKNFVPQTGQVRASCWSDRASLPGSSTDPPDSAFATPALLWRRLAHSSSPQSSQLGPRHLPVSCRSLSSGTHFERNSNGTAKSFHSSRQPLPSPQKSIGRTLRGETGGLPDRGQQPLQCSSWLCCSALRAHNHFASFNFF